MQVFLSASDFLKIQFKGHLHIKIIMYIKPYFLLSEVQFSEGFKISVVILCRHLSANMYVRVSF